MKNKKMEVIFKCMECGYKFRDPDNAERAQRYGCPGCGGTDIDLA